jgi:C4-dicarboxylate-specific signal transduction histidine kinase
MPWIDERDLLRLAARGALAGAVSAELAEPLAHVGRMLEATVDRIDRHVAASRGPEPLPVAAVGEIRERVAEAFLDLGRIARLAGDLALVTGASPERRPEPVDANDLVERALSLARHRFHPECEVMIDLGTLPRVSVDAVRVVGALAHLFIDVAAASPAGSTVLISTLLEPEAVRVTLAYPGDRAADRGFAGLVAADMAAEGATLTYTGDAEGTQVVLLLPLEK